MGNGQYQVTRDGAKVDDVRTYIFMEVVNCGTRSSYISKL